MSDAPHRLIVAIALVNLLECVVAIAAPQAPAAAPRQQAAPTTSSESPEIATLRKAAEQGDAVAQYNLGVMYHNGRGVPQDYTQAVSWFLKAADQGDAPAQFVLGVMYDNGHGVPQDYAQAASWCQKAANQGNADAMLNLGAMYFAGRGLPQDYVEALKWRSLAAAYASTDEQKTFIDARDAVAKVMTPEQVAEAKKRANEWVAAFEKRQK